MGTATETQPNGVSAPANAAESQLDTGTEKLTMEDLLHRVASLESTNSRLLDESKRFKTQRQEYKEKLDAQEKSRLEEQGKYKELYEAQKAKEDQLLKNIVRERVTNVVGTEAQKVGCLNPDALLKLGNSELLQYDESNNAVNGVEVFIEEAKKSYPFLFSTAKPANVNTITPGGGMVKQSVSSQDDLRKLNPEQRQQLMAKLMGG